MLTFKEAAELLPAPINLYPANVDKMANSYQY
jgi:hypothetical protein